MAGGLHGSARTTPRVRAELKAAKTSSRALAAQHGVNPETVLGRRKRSIACRCLHGAQNAQERRAHTGRRGHCRGVPPQSPAAARRHPRRPARHPPHPQPQRPAPTPPAARHPLSAQGRGQPVKARNLQAGTGRPRPCRQRSASLSRRRRAHVPGHRPRLQVRPRRVSRQRRNGHGSGFHARRGQGFPLPEAQSAHRQRRRSPRTRPPNTTRCDTHSTASAWAMASSIG